MITEDSFKSLQPAQAVIVYKRDTDTYLESHDIICIDNKFHWQEGKPFANEQLKELAIALGNESFKPLDIKGIMPENILYFQQTFFDYTLVWYLPSSKKKLHFSKSMNIDSGDVSLPGLIFAVKKGTLYVVTFKGKDKPKINTPLFKAPFYNIHDGSDVCMGNIKETKKKDVLQEEIARWENRFFNSYFSQLLDEDVISKKVNLQLLLKDLMESGQGFPEEHLVTSPYKTVEHFIKHIKNE